MRLVTVSAALALSACVAQAGEQDVSPRVVNGVIVTDGFEDDTGALTPDVRVFAYEFGEDPLDPPYLLPDPGFHPLPGSGFAEGSFLTPTFVGSLLFWNGLGPVAFGATPSGETMRLGFGTQPVVTLGGLPPSPDSLRLGPIDANGEFDDHLVTELLPGSAPIANGIYLVESFVAADGLVPSRPIWFLFNSYADDAALDAAFDYVQTQLVPEPATLSLLALGAMALRRRG